MVREGLTYYVRLVRDEGEKETNGVVQTLTIELKGAARLTVVYISPSVSGDLTESPMNSIINDGTDKDVIIGDLNARHNLWYTTTNARGRAITWCTVGNRYKVRVRIRHKYNQVEGGARANRT